MEIRLMSTRYVPMRKLWATRILAVLWLCLPGCFGSGMLFSETAVVHHPLIGQEKGRIWFHTDMASVRSVSAPDLRRFWGEPDEIVSNNLEETWLYKVGLRWNGFVLAFGVPVALIVPVGYNTMSFTIDAHNRVASVKLKGQQDDGLMCSLLPQPGCYVSTEWMCKVLPLCTFVVRRPFPKGLQELREEELIPGPAG
jgi:hypothetical protein